MVEQRSTRDEAGEAPEGSTEGVRDAWGQWQWSDAAAISVVEEAGFTDVEISVMPVFSKALLARGTKPGSSALEVTPEAIARSGRATQVDHATVAQP